MTTITAPHEALQSASFVIAFGGEGAAAYVVHGGWEAMLLRFVQETIDYAATALPGPDHPNAEEWAGWMEHFNDLDKWGGDEWGKPYSFSSEVGEISTVTIYRLSTDGAAPSQGPSHERQPIFPIARLCIDSGGNICGDSRLYAPGLPEGVHDVYPLPVDADGVPLP